MRPAILLSGSVNPPIGRLWVLSMGALVTTPALAQTGSRTFDTGNLLLMVILALLMVQTLLIAGLLNSRAKAKQARKYLAKTQKALEKRVVDRTNSLRSLNNQLYEEIAKLELTEGLLQETQAYLQSTINSMPSILIGVTRGGTITQWNTAAEQATGLSYSDALGKSVETISPLVNIELEMIHQAIDQGIAQVKEGVNQQVDGESRYMDMVIYPHTAAELREAVIMIDDVTMRVRFESTMIQNEKILSLGELAAGMAHEINNPLSAILHGVQNIYRRTSPELPANRETAQLWGITLEQVQGYLTDRDIYKFIDGIKDAGERSAAIVTNMLEFSRVGNRKHKPVNIEGLINHSLELAQYHLKIDTQSGKKPITIKKEFAPDLPLVPCSTAEIQQVILNIVRNAAQSFDAPSQQGNPDPTITLTLDQVEGAMIIKIADNGPGMNEATRQHIFEPFFTTKDVGKGTGLGLSVSYFIISEHHDGRIEADSTPGKGTAFTIYLPLEQPEPDTAHRDTKSHSAGRSLH